MSGTNKRKLSTKTLSTKYEALKKIEHGIPKKDVAAEYNVPRNTLSTWLKNEEKIVNAFESGNNRSTHKLKSSNYENLDKAVYKWFVKVRDEGLPVNDPILKEKAINTSGHTKGGKHSKARLTGLAAGNAVGEKLQCLSLGSRKKTWCFKGVRNLPGRYLSQKKSWMDSAFFEEWVCEQDRKFECEGRKVALIVDNCPAHPTISNLKAINLVFLPPNRTCKMQPMDQGIIRSIKAFYCGTTVRKYIDAVEKGMLPPKFTILDGMMILTGAWNRETVETVWNCFKKAGIGSEVQQSAVCDADDPFSFLSEELESLRESFPELVSTCVTLYDVIGTDKNVLTLNMESLTDEEILAEFRDDEIEMLDDGPYATCYK
ncbi:tigger transposable element-derived 4-like [Paramuricea clavata]|uniref:Tigger transposable element-derived 4-like n=1 Tax=Paramuricea clavata TaxID=317549 RepID=A0A7D9DLW3_PARCT|nr:tigger transposable element-derived 4-like [Paramuricea clavata]